MKDLLKILVLLLFFLLVYTYRNSITLFIVDNYINKKEPLELINNEYSLNYKFNYVKKTDEFIIKDKKQLLNVFYSYLDSGINEFYFYCDYENCENDVNSLNVEDLYSDINNFVHPYNTYNKLIITMNSWGKITIKIIKSYNIIEINSINKEINNIINKIITDNMSDRKKIEVFHDYIINSTSYDTNYTDNNINDITHFSHRATGPLLYSKALCGGYAHVMSIFLNKLKIPNYRISSDTHIWNLVYIDNNWYHLDLTWDDPVTSDKSNVLLHKFFLIDTNTLNSYNTGKHNFNKNIYLEANQVN